MVAIPVGLPGHLQDFLSGSFLSGNVNIGWDHGEHDRARVLHIPPHHISDDLNVCLRGQAIGSVLEDSGNVNDTEVVFFRATDFQAENVLGERGLHVGSVAVVF